MAVLTHPVLLDEAHSCPENSFKLQRGKYLTCLRLLCYSGQSHRQRCDQGPDLLWEDPREVPRSAVQGVDLKTDSGREGGSPPAGAKIYPRLIAP